MTTRTIAKLPTLAKLQEHPRATPKGSQPSRLEQKVAADKDDAKQLAQWRKEIAARDEQKCRVCGVRTIKTIARHPRRGEAHHLAGRADVAVRYDTRAAIHVCALDHERLTGTVNDRLEAIGTVFFEKAGKRYINADHKITFRKIA